MARYSTMLAALALALAAVPAAQAAPIKCSGTPKVSGAHFATAKPVNHQNAVSLAGLQQIFAQLAPLTDYRNNTDTTLSCVDSRGPEPQLGTLGGDFAEFTAGVYTYLKLTGQPVSGSSVNKTVKAVFRQFLADAAHPGRPFYFHSSAEKMADVFKAVAASGVSPEPAAFPSKMPETQFERDAWLSALSKPKAQGCGHVRLMLDNPGDYGMDSADVAKAMVRAFYHTMWLYEGTPDLQKLKFTLVPGSLASSRGIAVIEPEGACAGASPAVAPAAAGAQLFIYHPAAVKDFRSKVLAPWFAKYAKSQGKPLDEATFLKALEATQGKQLGATLKLLDPANSLPLWTITVDARNGTVAAAPRARPNAAIAPELLNDK